MPLRRRLSTGPRADRRRSSSNSTLFIAKSSILRLNIIPLLKRVDGVRGFTTTIKKRIKKGANLKPRKIRIAKAKRKAKGLIIILSLSLRPILRPKPSLRRLK